MAPERTERLASPRDLALGTVIGAYRIEALVGRGGMGVVYRARELDLDRIVALKVIAPDLVEDAAIRERFLRESRAAAAIEHPHVIPVHAAGEADGLAFLAMRFVEGHDLRARVRFGGPLAPQRAAAMIEQAAAGLDAIHRGGLVHRDIKPANLLVDDSGHVYVTDFGLVKHALSQSGGTTTGRWVGSLDYVSPEQVRGGRIDARADVYALGGVLYFALTGRVPFERDGDHAKLWAQLSEPAPRPSVTRPGIPIALDDVVARAMRKSADHRFPSAGDLARAASVATGGPLPLQPERMVARGAAAPGGAETEPGLAPEAETASALRETVVLPAPRPRRRWVLPAAVVAVLAIGVTTAALLTGESPEPGAGAKTGTLATPKPSAQVAETIRDVGTRPNGIVFAGGDLWVASHRETRLTRIDAATGRQREGPRVGGGATSISTDGERVWVANLRAKRVVGIDARTGRIFRRINVGAQPLTAKADRTGLWVLTSPPTHGAQYLLRYNREGERTLAEELPRLHSALALGDGSVWLADRARRGIVELDSQTLRRRSFTRVPGLVSSMSYAGGYVWVLSKENDTLAQLDPSGDRPTHTLVAAGHFPTQAVVAGGRLFVASRNDHTVLVYDPDSTQQVSKPLSVGRNPHALTTDGRSVWVTSLPENSVTRIASG